MKYIFNLYIGIKDVDNHIFGTKDSWHNALLHLLYAS